MADIERDLKITVTRDDAAYIASLRSTFRIESEQIKATAAQAKKAAKERADAAKAAAKSSAESAAYAAKIIKDAQKSVADQAASIRKADKAVEKELAAFAKETAAARRKAAKEAAEAAREALAETRKREREANAEKRRLMREQVAEETRQAKLTRDANRLAIDDQKHRFREASAARKADMDLLNQALKGGAAIGVAALREIEQAYNNISKQAMEATLKTIDYRKQLIELASLRGQAGRTGPELSKNLGLMSATGLSAGDAASMATAAYAGASSLLDRQAGAGVAGGPAIPARQGFMSREEYDKALTLAGQYRQFMGGEASSYGGALSTLLTMEGRRMSGDELAGTLVKYDQLGQLSKFKDPGQLMEQLKSVQGYVRAGVTTGSRMAGLVSAMALSGPAEQAATRAQQLINATSSGLVRERGMKVAEGFESETSASYFASLGITSKMDPIERAERVSDDLIARRKADPNFNADEFLLTHGVNNQEGRRALMEFSGNRGEWEQAYKPTMAATYTADSIKQTFAQASQADPAIRQGMVDAAGEAAEIALGAKGAAMMQSRRLAYENLKSQGKTMGSFEDYSAPAGWSDYLNPFSVSKAYMGVNPTTLDDEAARMIDADRKKQGLSKLTLGNGVFARSVQDVLSSNTFGSYDLRNASTQMDAYNVVQQANVASGGQSLPDASQIFERAGTNLDRAVGKLEKVLDRFTPKVPAAVPAAPAKIGSPP